MCQASGRRVRRPRRNPAAKIPTGLRLLLALVASAVLARRAGWHTIPHAWIVMLTIIAVLTLVATVIDHQIK